MFYYNRFNNHHYTLSSFGLKRNFEKTFSNVQDALKALYENVARLNLTIKEGYVNLDESRSYICDNGVEFSISRW